MNIEPGIIDETGCPLCGGSNICARADDKQAVDCWCFHTGIPRELIESVPPALKNRSCICQPCVEKANRLASPAR